MQPTDAPALTRDRLIADYHGYGRPRERWLIGGEFERHLLRADGHVVPYHGPEGVRWLMERMAPNGWDPYYEGDHLIAMFRDRGSITLEPGGQYEFSGAPWPTARQAHDEARAFHREVVAAVGGADVHPVALGYTPFDPIEDVPWVPKGRYVVMREHLAATGPLAHDMMKGTAATQASFDFSDERDAAAKVELLTTLGPLTVAMFANSPLRRGRPSGFASFRGHVWTQTDPARTGTPEAASAFTFEKWVDYLLDAPMMFTRIDGQWAPAHGRTFRSWMEAGINGVFPTPADWDLHQTSVFPEVRVKHTIEVRGADCVSMPLAGSFLALYRALAYSDVARDRARELADRLRAAGTRAQRFEIAARDGLRGIIGGRALAVWAEELVGFARAGLESLDPDDVPLLAPLERQIASGRSPADDLLEVWTASPRVATVLRVAAYDGA
jgi:glutamate--cysteine ligase